MCETGGSEIIHIIQPIAQMASLQLNLYEELGFVCPDQLRVVRHQFINQLHCLIACPAYTGLEHLPSTRLEGET